MTKILIIEDDTDINNLLARIMRRQGYEAVQAFSGTEGKLRLELEQYDLLLLDLMLPGMMGEELIGEIRQTDPDLTIPNGSIYGLVGNNGAGKTTLLKILLGQVYLTSGEFSLWEAREEEGWRKNRRHCGAIIEEPGFYPNMTAAQNLEYYRIQRGIPGRDKVPEKLEQVGLADAANKKFKQMSLGMKQRLGLALALLGEPQFLLLDEPINGLDPAGIIEIRSLLMRLNREKHITILISSHNLPELENMATDYGFLSRGRVVQQIGARQLHEQCGTYLEIRVTEPERYVALLERELHVTDYKVFPDGSIHIAGQNQDIAVFGRLAVEQGIDLLGLERREIQLEDYYMHLIAEQEGGEKR